MLNEAQISLTGYVATQPVSRTGKTGATSVSMRVAWTPRWQDRVTGEWVDGNTSYISVVCWRKLATNVAICVRKGDPVVVKGRLSIRNYDDKEGAPRTSVEVEASSVGHDLARGVAAFQRVRSPTGMTAAEYAASEQVVAGPAADARTSDGALAASSWPVGSADHDSWAGPGETGIPMPEEPDEAFFDGSAISDVVNAARDTEPAAVPF